MKAELCATQDLGRAFLLLVLSLVSDPVLPSSLPSKLAIVLMGELLLVRYLHKGSQVRSQKSKV